MVNQIRSHRDLRVYQRGFKLAMRIFDLSKSFPTDERYSLTSQIRRSSRSVCANITEAWKKRRYQAAFISKLSDAETEAAETQNWLDFAKACGYLPAHVADGISADYDSVMRTISAMIKHSASWVTEQPRRASEI